MDPLLSHESLISAENSANDALMFVEGLCWHNNVLSEESRNLKPVLVQTNAKLNESKTRVEGLLLLNCLLRQVSPQILAENCQQWAQHLKKFALHDPDTHVQCLSMKVFGEMLNLVIKDPEPNRHFASVMVPQFIPHLLNLDERYDLVVAHGLCGILRFLPATCRPHWRAIQKRLLEMISVKNSELVEVSSTCVALIPFLSGGERGKTQAATWSELYGRLCRSLQVELDVLYESLEVDQRSSKDSGDLILFPATLERSDPAAIFLDVFHRVVSICACLQKLLSIGSSMVLTVPVEATMALVGRMLKVTGKAVAFHSYIDKHMVLLFTFLPALHMEALVILEKLILSCRRHLLLHDQKILSLFFQTLQWTSVVQKRNDDSRQALSKLRGVVYRVFTTWLNVAGAGSDLSHLGDGITRHMLLDVLCERKAPELANLSPARARSKSGKKRKLEEPLLGAQTRPTLLVDSDTCCLSLKGLKSVVYNAVEDLKAGTFKDLCSKTISILLTLQPGATYPAEVPPYGDVNCRAALYELLLAVLVVPGAVSHALLSKGIHIFSRGQLDHNTKVTEACCQGLAVCRSLIEPIRQCLPEGLPDPTQAGEDSDDRPETSSVDDEMEVTEETNDLEKHDSSRSSQQEATENGFDEKLPVEDIEEEENGKDDVDEEDEVEDEDEEEVEVVDEEEEKEKDEKEKVEVEDEEEEEEEDEEALVKENPTVNSQLVVNLQEEEVVKENPGVYSQVNVNLKSPIPTAGSNADESLDSSDSSINKMEVVAELNKSAKDVNCTVEPSTVDVILHSFVDSYPDDHDNEGPRDVEIDEKSE